MNILLSVFTPTQSQDPLEVILSFILFVIVFLFFLAIAIGAVKERRELLNHWNILIPNLQYSSKEFYDTLTKRLKDQNVDQLTMRMIEKNTGGILSGKRLYAVAKYDDYEYEVCAAPFGDSFFVSYWMHFELRIQEKIVAGIPFIGEKLLKGMFPVTYYRIDTSDMFHTMMHEIITSMVDEISVEKNLEKLSENQKIPKMTNVFKR